MTPDTTSKTTATAKAEQGKKKVINLGRPPAPGQPRLRVDIEISDSQKAGGRRLDAAAGPGNIDVAPGQEKNYYRYFSQARQQARQKPTGAGDPRLAQELAEQEAAGENINSQAESSKEEREYQENQATSLAASAGQTQAGTAAAGARDKEDEAGEPDGSGANADNQAGRKPGKDDSGETPAPEQESGKAGSGLEARIAKRLKDLRDKRRTHYEESLKASNAAKGPKIFQDYKKLKSVIRAIKLMAAAGTSLGDVFFSFGMFFLSLNGEWVFAWWVNKRLRAKEPDIKEDDSRLYKLDIFDKVIFYGGWILILAVLAAYAILVIIIIQFYSEYGHLLLK